MPEFFKTCLNSEDDNGLILNDPYGAIFLIEWFCPPVIMGNACPGESFQQTLLFEFSFLLVLAAKLGNRATTLNLSAGSGAEGGEGS